MCMSVCVCVCVRGGKREKEGGIGDRKGEMEKRCESGY